MSRDRRRRVIAGIVALAGIVAIASLAVAVGVIRTSTEGDEHATLEILVKRYGTPIGETEAAPAEYTEFARSLYERSRRYCRQPWSALLYDAGEPPSRSFSRSALRDVASRLPNAKRFIDQLLASFATEGCVAGFSELLKSNPSYAIR